MVVGNTEENKEENTVGSMGENMAERTVRFFHNL
jgi:hypothetical protein